MSYFAFDQYTLQNPFLLYWNTNINLFNASKQIYSQMSISMSGQPFLATDVHNNGFVAVEYLHSIRTWTALPLHIFMTFGVSSRLWKCLISQNGGWRGICSFKCMHLHNLKLHPVSGSKHCISYECEWISCECTKC